MIVLSGISDSDAALGARTRRDAEARLHDNDLDLEATVDRAHRRSPRANDEIHRFAYIVSHDLRSPLVNVIGSPPNSRIRGDLSAEDRRSAVTPARARRS